MDYEDLFDEAYDENEDSDYYEPEEVEMNEDDDDLEMEIEEHLERAEDNEGATRSVVINVADLLAGVPLPPPALYSPPAHTLQPAAAKWELTKQEAGIF